MPLNFIKRIFGYKELPFPDGYFVSDKRFNQLYPPYIQQVARRHFTPLEVAKKAADFLVDREGVKILDVGSGAGKFCIAASYYKPTGVYTGIELRKNLVEQAEFTKNKLALGNITFIHGDFTTLDFKLYNHFYFYNSFYEHVVEDGRIDNSIAFSKEAFSKYFHHLFKQLERMPAGTKVVTYHVTQTELPPFLKVVCEDVDGYLKFCVKM